MKKVVYLSIACAALLQAAEIETETSAAKSVAMETITVESTTISDVSGEEIKSADVAEALAKKVPSITLVRRSGIANDIILRGQKRDNINVIVDEGKIYGACPNRMDPPTSHVITNNIDSIEIIEGPYDVEHFGTLSGLVNITTKKPEKGIHGTINLNAGSFDYKKASATIEGGTDTVRALIGVSGESSGQYEDGDGNTFADQIDNAIAAGQAATGNAFQDKYRDMDAYTKKSFLGKLFVDITEDQELRLSYTGNRSDDVLYPNTPMDAIYDNSDLYNAQYSIKNLGGWSKALDLNYYYSYVDHPMATKYRKAGLANVVTNHLESTIQGATIKNATELTDSLEMTLGLDGSLRNWDGLYDVNGTVPVNPISGGYSINDADTRNVGIFAEFEKRYADISLKLGLRYDDTKITSGDAKQQDNNYQALSGNLYVNYDATKNLGFFGGIGKASRVPDGRELYFYSKPSKKPDGTPVPAKEIGTPDLQQTTNYQADLGMENRYDAFNLKTKVYYSKLEDYIYFNSTKPANKFVNIDASIYGIEISGTWYALESLYLDFGAAYQRGQKDHALEGQTNTNLADIPPLKGNVALNWLYYDESVATVEFVGADKWDEIDSDNGEQEIDAWGIVNLKVDHKFPYGFGLAVGVDNLFDETYAVSNTYKDLTLLSVDPDAEVMLMNEPGRYFYVNASYTF
jgi:iron complex outermembrane receptor protein